MNSKNVLWQLGLAIALGIGGGYIIGLKLGIILGCALGGLLAFIIADPQSIRKEFPVMCREFKIGFIKDIDTIPQKTRYVVSGFATLICVKIIATVLFIIGFIFCIAGIPSLCFDSLLFYNDGGTAATWGRGLTIGLYLVGVICWSTCERIFSLAQNKSFLKWPLIRKIRINIDTLKSFDCTIVDDVDFLPFRNQEGKMLSGEAVAVSLILLFFWTLPIVLMVLATITIIVFMLDSVLTMFFAVSNSWNTAAGISAFIGIAMEYWFYPTMSLSAPDIMRFAAFSVGGGIVGMLLYKWKVHLLMKQASEELALAA